MVCIGILLTNELEISIKILLQMLRSVLVIKLPPFHSFIPGNCVCNRLVQVTKRKVLSVTLTKRATIAKCNYPFNTKLPEKTNRNM